MAPAEPEDVSLERVTPTNLDETLALRVASEQEDLVSSNVRSLADAYVWPAARPRLVRHGGRPVGFVMTFPFEEDGRRLLNLVRLMVDAGAQRQGVGGTTLRRVVDDAREEGFAAITLSVVAENRAAIALYERFGFQHVGDAGDERRYELRLR